MSEEVSCPVCHSRLRVAEIMPMTERQEKIRAAVSDLCRWSQRGTASTKAIAAAVGWSVPTVQRELHVMEQHMRAVVRDADRPKSGWKLPGRVLTLVRDRAA